jgi:hypothetical protein
LVTRYIDSSGRTAFVPDSFYADSQVVEERRFTLDQKMLSIANLYFLVSITQAGILLPDWLTAAPSS